MEEGAELFKLYKDDRNHSGIIQNLRQCEDECVEVCVCTCREHCRSLMAFRLPFQWSSWKTVISS